LIIKQLINFGSFGFNFETMLEEINKQTKTMKKLFIIALVPFIFAACENKEQTARIQQLEEEQNMILSEAQTKDSLINDFMQTLNEIESNLAEIKSREKLISKETASGTELNKSARQRVNEDIRLINELMAENKQKIESLNKKLKQSNIRIAEFEKMVESTNQQLAIRDKEIDSLKTELSTLNFTIAVLNDTISQISNRNLALNSQVTDRTNELNTAYFVVGERKDLIEQKILTKEGGVLGIGRTQRVAGDVNLDEFTKVDIRNLKTIPLHAKKVKVMSVHPAGSYELIGNDKQVSELVIKDPALFWQKSRMLVISTEV
jgi:predicted  nucleic acid-binding Zn-ribbon protein